MNGQQLLDLAKQLPASQLILSDKFYDNSEKFVPTSNTFQFIRYDLTKLLPEWKYQNQIYKETQFVEKLNELLSQHFADHGYVLLLPFDETKYQVHLLSSSPLIKTDTHETIKLPEKDLLNSKTCKNCGKKSDWILWLVLAFAVIILIFFVFKN